MAEEYLTVQEAAKLLGVPVSWVYAEGARLKRGERTRIPIVKLGKYLRVPKGALLAKHGGGAL